MGTTSLPRELFLGFVKAHILYHACNEPVYGLWLIEELAHHGYRLSPGTLYPMLHSLERDGLLTSEKQVIAGKARKVYLVTGAGRTALQAAREQAVELLREISGDLEPPWPPAEAG